MLAPEMVAGKSRIAKMIWISLMERINLKNARAIHVTSEIEADGVRAMGLNLAPVAVVGNGVERPTRRPTQEEIHEIWGDVLPGRRVAFLGRLDWTKGADLAIEAARAHPDAIIRLAGYDQIGLRRRLEPLLFRENGSRCGDFLGELVGPRKWAFLAGADVLLVPSVRESFGMSLAESLIVGTPAIATEGVGAASFLRRLDPELVIPRRQSALNEALGRVLADRDRRVSVGDRAQKLAISELSWSNAARRMTELYSSIPQ
jgi:glycosyltransferase involved in cell wall biosynthesis